eukprot:1145488-Pelagomonas_calceolata.AAC.4
MAYLSIHHPVGSSTSTTWLSLVPVLFGCCDCWLSMLHQQSLSQRSRLTSVNQAYCMPTVSSAWQQTNRQD